MAMTDVSAWRLDDYELVNSAYGVLRIPEPPLKYRKAGHGTWWQMGYTDFCNMTIDPQAKTGAEVWLAGWTAAALDTRAAVIAAGRPDYRHCMDVLSRYRLQTLKRIHASVEGPLVKYPARRIV
jgi:hypothetical protein